MWRAAILYFFFFQLITDFVGAVYAFGLMGVAIPPEIIAVLLLLSPLLLLARRRGVGPRLLAVGQALVLLAAAAELPLDTRGRLLVSGLGVAVFLLVLPSLLWSASRDDNTATAGALDRGLALALGLAVLCRAWNSGADPSLQTWYRIAAWLLAAAGLLVVWRSVQRPAARIQAKDAIESSPPIAAEADAATQVAPAVRPVAFGRVAALSLGVVAALTLLYFAFSSPHVIARWVGADALPVVGVVMLALGLFAAAAALAPDRIFRLPRPLMLAWNVVFAACLVGTLLSYRIGFSPDPVRYPLAEPPAAWPAPLLWIATCLLWPVILLDFTLYTGALVAARPSIRKLGGGFTLAGLFLLLAIFGQVFTTTYDYIPVVGPLFRDRFWAVYLALALALAMPALALRGSPNAAGVGDGRGLTAVPVAGVIAVAGLLLTMAHPGSPPQQAGLRILTYNIQQGYSAAGLANYTGQLAVMAAANADVIGLEESDTSRISGSNSDLVHYFADRLNMYTYYGPKVGAGTFGVALLSRYPILAPQTIYLYSQGEQVAAIRARIPAGGKLYNVVVTHLGNDGPLVQQTELLATLKGLPNVILMGDFNFTPASEQYGLTRRTFADGWLTRWPQGSEDNGLTLPRRIDYIFLSPGTGVAEARYLVNGQSDHPALFATITR